MSFFNCPYPFFIPSLSFLSCFYPFFTSLACQPPPFFLPVLPFHPKSWRLKRQISWTLNTAELPPKQNSFSLWRHWWPLPPPIRRVDTREPGYDVIDTCVTQENSQTEADGKFRVTHTQRKHPRNQFSIRQSASKCPLAQVNDEHLVWDMLQQLFLVWFIIICHSSVLHRYSALF